MNSFYSYEELEQFNFKHLGNNVLISRKASVYSPDKISIGNDVRIDDFCILSGNIEIGNFVHIAAFSALYGGDEGILIKDFANLSSRVSVYSKSDDYSGLTMSNPMIPDSYKNVNNGRVVIERHVIIGATSVILPGRTIPEGCAFGAFSFINNEYDEWSIYAGIPSKKIKDRKKDVLTLEKQFLKEIGND